jgi:hypothetical protein
MPRKKRSKETEFKILAALDEIEAAQDLISKKRVAKPVQQAASSWIRKQKAHLKELGYKGKMPRQKKVVGQVIYVPRPKNTKEEDE